MENRRRLGIRVWIIAPGKGGGGSYRTWDSENWDKKGTESGSVSGGTEPLHPVGPYTGES